MRFWSDAPNAFLSVDPISMTAVLGPGLRGPEAEAACGRWVGQGRRELGGRGRGGAGEIGAGHTVTALYEVVPAGAGAEP